MKKMLREKLIEIEARPSLSGTMFFDDIVIRVNHSRFYVSLIEDGSDNRDYPFYVSAYGREIERVDGNVGEWFPQCSSTEMLHFIELKRRLKRFIDG